MTRLWAVPPKYLCEQHLLGEHKEMHQEAGTLANHPHGDAICYGHAKKAQVRVGWLEQRHDKLATELSRRGNNHNSPFDYDLSEYDDIGYVDRYANVVDLYNRCDACAERIEQFGGFV